MNWKDVEWIRSIWHGKLVLKGILDPEDAREALKTGADGVVVSNHGGRQLDGAPSTIPALPKVADAIGGQKEILLDSGVRTGQDIFRALALGANACMIGRAFLYGLGAGGEAGVTRAISILRGELDTTMILAGIDDVKKIDHRAIASELPGEFAATKLTHVPEKWEPVFRKGHAPTKEPRRRDRLTRPPLCYLYTARKSLCDRAPARSAAK